MATSSTMVRFQIELTDIDRGVYETLDVRTAFHPSEDAARLMVRVLARAVAHEENLEFGRGLSDPEDPAIASHDMTGALRTWIDVGAPTAERLHRASKRAEQVMVFTDKPIASLKREWSSRKIHKSDDIEIVCLEAPLTAALAEQFARNVTWHLMIQDQRISVTVNDATFDGMLQRRSLSEFLASASD